VRSLVVGGVVAILVAGLSFAWADAPRYKTRTAKVLPCRVTTVYLRSNGHQQSSSRVSYHICIPGAAPACNFLPPEGICSGYWGVGIVNKICQVVGHC
jgi:hypothetical protein